ncbi:MULTISPECIES: AraC family transcriptional regulator [Aliarcobacter]|jgi:AraC-like DNA-binding protein|nr:MULTISPECIES: AraC family transcriptional regulator [Aliarcobacter]MCT7584712.1 AraC family transcriptional regulator [Aliarcobacter butzleri]
MIDLLNNTFIESVQNTNINYNKHFHNTYSIGLTYSGVIKVKYVNKTVDSYKYTVRVTNPGDVHSAEVNSLTHASFCPKVELVSKVYEDMYGYKKIPFFENYLIEDKILFFKLHNFFYSYFQKKDFLLVETNLIEVLSYMIENYTISTKAYIDIFCDKKIVKDTYEFINDSIDMNFTLDELASNIGLSKYHFIRVFKKEFGLSPYEFILNERVNRAHEFIQKGMSISEASFQVGFTDQSHFTKNSKKFFAHTPSYLKKNSNILL